MISEKHTAILIAILIGIVLCGWLIYTALRQDLQVNRRTIWLHNLPEAFDGLKIAHLSDLHGCEPKGLIESVSDMKPDLIFCTGDLYDGVQHADTTNRVLQQLQSIAPVYLVSGNHEYYSGSWPQRVIELKSQGFHVLENEVETITKGPSNLEIAGVRDPDLDWHWKAAKRSEQLHEDLDTLPEKKVCRLMLFHRADLFDELSPEQADMVFSGHLHGGQWRLFGMGVIAPSDGDRTHLFPEYDAGVFTKNGMVMHVSRGLGDQMAVPRLFNRPEVIEITLRAPETDAAETVQTEDEK